jgi:hypothetical protein
VTEADVFGAVFDFVKTYALPALPPENIFRHGQNRTYLPPDSNEFAAMTVISHERRGWNVEDYDSTAENPEGVLTSSELILCRVQVDFYSDDDNSARLRAQMIETACGSSAAAQFFGQHGMSCNFANNARHMGVVDGSRQFVDRWIVELNVSFVSAFSVELPWFSAANVHIENVDVHHPPREV